MKNLDISTSNLFPTVLLKMNPLLHPYHSIGELQGECEVFYCGVRTLARLPNYYLMHLHNANCDGGSFKSENYNRSHSIHHHRVRFISWLSAIPSESVVLISILMSIQQDKSQQHPTSNTFRLGDALAIMERPPDALRSASAIACTYRSPSS